jgi:hypothetical protein
LKGVAAAATETLAAKGRAEAVCSLVGLDEVHPESAHVAATKKAALRVLGPLSAGCPIELGRL